MKAIILVGGFGTRLRPLTLHQPKPLLSILNIPFLAYQLELLKEGGVKDIILAIGHQTKQWDSALKKLAPKGVRLIPSIEKKPMGTGGAIRLAYETGKKKIRSSQGEPFVVFNGDILLNLNLKTFVSFHRTRKAHASIAMVRVEDVSRYGLIQFGKTHQIRRFLEKPRLGRPGFINAGAYLLTPEFLENIPKTPNSVERDVFSDGIKKEKALFGYPIRGYWNDIGTHQTFLQAHSDLIRRPRLWTQNQLFRKRSGRRLPRYPFALMGKGATIGKNVSFKGVVCLGKKVKIEDNCHIEESVLFDGVRVGKGTQIRKALIGQRCQIGANAQIKEGTVLGDNTILSPYSKT